MAEPVEMFRYIRYLRLRWIWIAVSATVAVVLAAGISLWMPRQYTATARILIEPPAGTDLRSAMAVSPIYLESLKTYEHFASSDSLFQRAANQFSLQKMFAGQPLESIKKRVLKVGIVRNTRILEVSVTLPDANRAQALAQFVGKATVDLTRSVVSEGDRDLIGAIEAQEQQARASLQEIEVAWAKAVTAEPTTELQAEMENGAELRAQLQRELANAQLLAADPEDRDNASAKARIPELQKQIQRIDQRLAERERTLSQRSAHRSQLEADRKARQAELAAAETRLREARSDAGYRGERMKLIDPGVVPERPSSPNLMLNVLAALLLGLILPVAFLAVEMNYQDQRIAVRRGTFVHSGDE